MIKHQRMMHLFNNTEMRLRWKYAEVASWCAGIESKLKGKEGEETIEGVSLFTYLGRPLAQFDNDNLEVRRNIGKERQVWVIIGGILRREGADHITSADLYRAVVQAVVFSEKRRGSY